MATHSICSSCRAHLLLLLRRSPQVLSRHLHTSPTVLADDQAPARTSRNSRMVPPLPRPRNPQQGTPQPRTGPPPGAARLLRDKELSNILQTLTGVEERKTSEEPSEPSDLRTAAERENEEMYHFHVYATKHNTHITLTNPKRDPMLSLSTGNLGFRKANRGTFDAAYQLAVYVMGRMEERGWMRDIQSLEVVLRGFGVGREAVSKCLVGVEGQGVRGAIRRVADATRLKFGGTRSRKIRRLG